jgi:hypothetical protein
VSGDLRKKIRTSCEFPMSQKRDMGHPVLWLPKRWFYPPLPTETKASAMMGHPRFLVTLLVLTLFSWTNGRAQVIDGFSWVDMKSDAKTVDRVKELLGSKSYTAIREIGLVGEHALVIASLRNDPIANPMNDSFVAYGVSLHDGSVEELLDGTNLKYIDWQKFYDYDTPELVATYDDCAQCKATTFLTAFYIDRKTRRWGARWRREVAGAPLYSADPAKNYVYALFMNVDQKVVLDTWVSYPEQKKSSRGGEFLFEYRIDVPSDQGTSRPLSGRDVLPVKQRLCTGQSVVFGIAGGQDSEACAAISGKASSRKR